MKLVENWKEILAGAWSVRLMVVACVIGALPLFFELVNADFLGLSPVMFAALASFVSALAAVARVIQQVALPGVLKQFTDDEGGWVRTPRTRRGKAFAVVTAFAVAASTLVMPWEGLRTTAYKDIVGVWTVCYGETKGVSRGDSYTPEACETMLASELQSYADGLGRCLTAEVPEGAGAAFISWTYNVGVGAACRSTLVRKANAGDLFGACDELLRWNKAGGRVVRGLTNRRMAERELCLDALVDAGLERSAK